MAEVLGPFGRFTVTRGKTVTVRGFTGTVEDAFWGPSGGAVAVVKNALGLPRRFPVALVADEVSR